MRAIIKNAEPVSLTEHRSQSHSDYNGYIDKITLRASLVDEQNGLCCYCMGRITANPRRMKVEHWHCQSRYPQEQLDYRNMLGACLGGDGQPPYLQHCDTHKGDRDLQWNPAIKEHYIEARLRYEADGSIRADDAQFDTELREVLNLNLPLLKNNRKGVFDSFLDWWRNEKRKVDGPVPRALLERAHARLTRRAGELAPYCQVAVWLLEQRLAR